MRHRAVSVVITAFVLVLASVPAHAADVGPIVDVWSWPITVGDDGSGGADVTLASHAYVEGYPDSTYVVCDSWGTAVSFDTSEFFGVGWTDVSCTAAWYEGGPSTPFSMAVQVNELTGPDVYVWSDPVWAIEDPAGSGSAYVNLSSHAYVEGYPFDSQVSCVSGDAAVPFDGWTFPVGYTWVSCTAAWLSGGPTSEFSVGVYVEEIDDTPPVLTPLNDPWVVGESGGTGAWVRLPDNITVDEELMEGVACATDPHVDLDPWGYSWIPIGTYAVSCWATDLAGNTGYGTYTLEVVDPSVYYQLSIEVLDALVDPKTGTATVTVSVSALHDGWIAVNGELVQKWGRRLIRAHSDEAYGSYVVGTPWIGHLSFASEDYVFVGGNATLTLDAHICSGAMSGVCDWTGPNGLTMSIKLKSAKR